MSFDEYLRAIGFSALADIVLHSSPDNPMSDVLHSQCLTHFVRFVAIGGMPQVVATFAQNGSLQDCQQVLDDLILTFVDDFAKYKARVYKASR